MWRSLWLGVLACCLVVAAPAAPDLDAALAYAASRRDAYVSELSEIVALPSVSAQPERLPDLLKASQWVKARLEAAGLQVGDNVLDGGRNAYGDAGHLLRRSAHM